MDSFMFLVKNESKSACILTAISILVLLLFSCSTTDSDEVEVSHFYASINGPSMNGEIRIDDDEDPSTLNFSGLIVPAHDDKPAVAVLSFNDYEGLVITIQVPGEERLTELTENHEFFGMVIGDTNNEINLLSRSVSIHVTRLKNNSAGITEMRANFEGVMVHDYFEDGNRIEEEHTVKGDFAFTQNTFDFF